VYPRVLAPMGWLMTRLNTNYNMGFRYDVVMGYDDDYIIAMMMMRLIYSDGNDDYDHVIELCF